MGMLKVTASGPGWLPAALRASRSEQWVALHVPSSTSLVVLTTRPSIPVGVGVGVRVAITVPVGVAVGVRVAVGNSVPVGVADGVAVGDGGPMMPGQKPALSR